MCTFFDLHVTTVTKKDPLGAQHRFEDIVNQIRFYLVLSGLHHGIQNVLTFSDTVKIILAIQPSIDGNSGIRMLSMPRLGWCIPRSQRSLAHLKDTKYSKW